MEIKSQKCIRIEKRRNFCDENGEISFFLIQEKNIKNIKKKISLFFSEFQKICFSRSFVFFLLTLVGPEFKMPIREVQSKPGSTNSDITPKTKRVKKTETKQESKQESTQPSVAVYFKKK